MLCKWCKDTGQLLLVDNYINCTECEKGKQKEKSEKKIFDQLQGGELISGELIRPSLSPTIIQSEIKQTLVRGNANIPGCGSEPRLKTKRINTSPWSEIRCSDPVISGPVSYSGHVTSFVPSSTPQKLLFSSEEIPVGYEYQFEILAGSAGGFKPRSVQLIGRSTNDFDIYRSIKILDVSCMGYSQFVNYYRYKKYLDSDFLKTETVIDWCVFGSMFGQGLQWIVLNHHDSPVSLSVVLKGEIAECNLIGMGYRHDRT